MPTQRPAPPPTITVVESPACHFCHDAVAALGAMAALTALEIRTVRIDTDEGRALVAHHRPTMSPLVLLDGEYFSSGRLPRKKLAKALAGRAARVGA